jgi:hypothetical protein
MRDAEIVEKNGIAGVPGGLADTRTGKKEPLSRLFF